MSQFLTTAEVAAEFRVSPETVRAWVEDERLPTVKLGPKTFRFRRSDVEAFIANADSSSTGNASQTPSRPDEPAQAEVRR